MLRIGDRNLIQYQESGIQYRTSDSAMNGRLRMVLFWIDQRLCRDEPRLRKYTVASREMTPEIRKKLLRKLAASIGKERQPSPQEQAESND